MVGWIHKCNDSVIALGVCGLGTAANKLQELTYFSLKYSKAVI